MPMTMRILPHRSLVFATMSGELTVDDLRDAVSRFSGHPDFKVDLDRLMLAYDDLEIPQWLLSDMFTVKEDMIEKYFGGEIPPVENGPLYKTAVVSQSQGNAMIARLFQAVLNADMPSVVEIKTFDSAECALDWLGRTDLALEELEPEMSDFRATA